MSIRKNTTSSNETKVFFVSRDTSAAIFNDEVDPKTYEEKMIYSYNKVLTKYLIFIYQTLDESFILNLHYELYESYNHDFDGKYKICYYKK